MANTGKIRLLEMDLARALGISSFSPQPGQAVTEVFDVGDGNVSGGRFA